MPMRRTHALSTAARRHLKHRGTHRTATAVGWCRTGGGMCGRWRRGGIRQSTRALYNCAMTELIFLVENSPEGGYTAKAVGASIFTEADDLASLEKNVREAVHCHFDDDTERPR